jgi:hypothetical protein
MPTSTSSTLGDKWWNRGKAESEWTDQPPAEAVPSDATGTTPITTPMTTTTTTPRDYSGGINSYFRAPDDAADAQKLLEGLQNFVSTGGSQISPALREKVNGQINALINYGQTNEYVAPGGSTTTTTTTPSAGNAYGTKANLDKDYLTTQIKAAFAKKGITNPAQSDIDYWINKASNPEMYSDGKMRVGWNPYWEQRLVTGQASADPSLAGDEGVLDSTQYASLYQGQAGGAGGMTLSELFGGRPAINQQVTTATSQGYAPTATGSQGYAPTATGSQSYTPTTIAGTGAATIGARPDVGELGGGVAQLAGAPGLREPGQFGYQPYQLPSQFAYGEARPEFVAPTAESLTQDPGYQARLAQGQQTLEQSAAARGTLRGGATLKALQDYGQQMASQEYQNAYARALQDYQNRVAAQQTGYQQAIGTYGLNTQTGMQGQAQQYGQALSAAQLNAQNALAQNQQALSLYQTQVNAQLANQQMQNQALQLRQQLIQQGYTTDVANALANQQLQNQMAQYNATAANQAGQFGAASANQAALANAAAANQAGQFGAASANQAALANAVAANQAGQFGAAAGNQASLANAQMANQANQFYNSLIQQGYTQDVAAAMTQQQINNQASQFGQTYGLQSAQQGFNNQFSIANLGLQAAQLYANNPYLQALYGSSQNAGNIGAAGTIGSTNPWITGLGNIGNLAAQYPWLSTSKG